MRNALCLAHKDISEFRMIIEARIQEYRIAKVLGILLLLMIGFDD